MTVMAAIGKQFTFDAAHMLPNHSGKCANLHGHTYRVELVVTGAVRETDGASDEGMVVDFAVLSKAWKRLHGQVDHAFLNDVLPDDYQPTTAENLAIYIADQLRESVPQLASVRVWETPTSWALVRTSGEV